MFTITVNTLKIITAICLLAFLLGIYNAYQERQAEQEQAHVMTCLVYELDQSLAPYTCQVITK